MTGPFGNITYSSPGKFTTTNTNTFTKINKIGMICGGTGISPMFQLLQKILSNRNDHTAISLIYCTKLIEEMSFTEDLINFDMKGKLSFYPVVENPETNNWLYGKGKVCEEVINDYMPSVNDKKSVIFVCGPDGMINGHLLPILSKMGYEDERILYYV